MEELAATPPGQAPMVQPPGNGGPPRAHEQPAQTAPGQAPMAEPSGPPAEDTDPERQQPR